MSFIRKFNKLKRDPVGFFRDSRFLSKRKLNVLPDANSRKNPRVEPRILYKFLHSNGVINVINTGRKVIDKEISSVILTRPYSNYNNAPIINVIRKYNSSVFREKVFFYGECEEGFFDKAIDLRKNFNDNIWRITPL